jgi:polar amino acid transport system ATP-binding protein
VFVWAAFKKVSGPIPHYDWDFGVLWTYRTLLVRGVGTTILFTIACVALGLVVGVVTGLGRLSANPFVAAPLRAYVELFRCTPVLVQLVWFYYALPVLTGIEISAIGAATLSLTLYGGAFYSEIVRGGVISIDVGQVEAAKAIGMTPYQAMRRVILPQAFRRMVPPLISQSIMQLKNTSLLSVLAVPDLLYQGQVIAHETYRPLELYTFIAVAYFVILLPVTLWAKRLEFGAAGVLKGVDLEVQRGQVVAIIGPSGSGKSTLLRCINLLTIPDGGRIAVGDHAVAFQGQRTALPSERALAKFRASTGMVFQHFNLFPHMTVMHNVMEGPVTVLRKPRSEAEQTARELLAKVGLQDRAQHFPDKLSGGQKQRVAIARALAMKPEVMLFDECTSALDPELVGEVLGVIQDLAKDGMTMILVTHEIAFAREVADHVVFMRDGVIVEAGPPGDVIDHPRNESLRAFLGRFNASLAAGAKPR